jgi:SAM-dependent methyltransferase
MAYRANAIAGETRAALAAGAKVMPFSLRYATFQAASSIREPFSRRRRAIRMMRFIDLMKIRGGEKVIDLGGTTKFWVNFPFPLDITIVNLPGEAGPPIEQDLHKIRVVEGDACDVDFASDNSYDIAFSNSVIEHVGPEEKQEQLAREARRLAPRYWVQTPSIWFPIEAHNHMPFWWFYPEPAKAYFIERWRRKVPAWTEMIEGTTVLSKGALQAYFPEAKIITERYVGITKSYIAYRD